MEYLKKYAESASGFYQFGNTEFANIMGYEYYGGLANIISKKGFDQFNDFLANLQFWGSPEEVTGKLKSMIDEFDIGGLIVYTKFGGMPHELAWKKTPVFLQKKSRHI